MIESDFKISIFCAKANKTARRRSLRWSPPVPASRRKVSKVVDETSRNCLSLLGPAPYRHRHQLRAEDLVEKRRRSVFLSPPHLHVQIILTHLSSTFQCNHAPKHSDRCWLVISHLVNITATHEAQNEIQNEIEIMAACNTDFIVRAKLSRSS